MATTAPHFALDHVGVFVRSDAFEDTVRFYERYFGLTRIRDTDIPPRVVFLSDGAMAIEFVAAAEATPPDRNHLALRVTPSALEELIESMRAAGVPMDPVRQSSDGSTSVFVHDPGGNLCQVLGRDTRPGG